MKVKDRRVKHKAVIVLLMVAMLCLLAALVVWVYGRGQMQSEACREWEELKSQNEREGLQFEPSDSELQQGVSISQAQEIKYRKMCQEE